MTTTTTAPKSAAMLELEAQRDELAQALFEAEQADVAFKAAKAKFEAENAHLIARKDETSKRASALRAVVEDAALVAWQEAPATKLTDGIGMQLRTQVDYNPAELFKACLQFAPFLLQVNVKAVKDLGESAPDKKDLNAAILSVLPITISPKPTPTIGDPTLIKYHQMRGAEQVVERATAVVDKAWAAPAVPLPEDGIDGAIEAAMSALGAVAVE